MAKSRTKHSNDATYLSPLQRDDTLDSNTERSSNGSFPQRKPTYILICTFVAVFAFVVGITIGFFAKSEVCGDNEAVISQQRTRTHHYELGILLNNLDEEKIRNHFRYGTDPV